jgi:hypothetical protein
LRKRTNRNGAEVLSLSLGRRKAMPGLDGTGPRGIGPMTGRGMGYCVVPLSTQEEELDYLRKRAEAIRRNLKQIEVRIRKLEKAKSAVNKE